MPLTLPIMKWLNQWDRLSQLDEHNRTVSYSPEHCRLSIPKNPVGLSLLERETLDYLHEQLPALKSFTLTGPGDPLLLEGLPQVFQWAEENEIVLHIETSLSAESARRLQEGRWPDVLSIYLGAHKPSYYYQLTGQSAEQFADDFQQLSAALRHKPLKTTLELGFFLLRFHGHEVASMAETAIHFGAQHIAFEREPEYHPFIETLSELASESLDFTWKDATKQLAPYPIAVTAWPFENRTASCPHPFKTLTMNWEFKVSACPRWQATHEDYPHPSLWADDVWNQPHFQWLRSIHSGDLPTPTACQGCAERGVMPQALSG